jgi:hypothetical protein
MKDYDVWEKYQADQAASKKAKEEAKYEAGKRALDSKYDQKKKSEEIVRASKLKDAYAAAARLNKPQWMKDNEARIANFNSKSKKSNKSKPVKVTEKEITVETPAVDAPLVGNIGSVDRMNPEVIGPDMGRTKPAPIEERSFNMPKDESSRFSSSNPMGMKRGGAVKSSASSRGDGIAQRGRTKGRMC